MITICQYAKSFGKSRINRLLSWFYQIVLFWIMGFSPIISSADNITVSPANCNSTTLLTDTGPATLNADWEANNVNIAWYNDGTQITNDVNAATQCTYDQTFSLPTQPTKTGYIFTGWTAVPATLVNGVTNAANTRLCSGINSGATDIEFEIRVKPSLGSFYIFQARDSSSNLCGISGSSSGATIGFSCPSGATSSIVRDASHIYYIKASRNGTAVTLYVKDETTGEEEIKVGSVSSAPPTAEICFYGNTKGNYVNSGNTIYMAKLRIDGDLVLDYVPAIQNSTVGFFDKVSKTFKTVSTGSLTAGNPL